MDTHHQHHPPPQNPTPGNTAAPSRSNRNHLTTKWSPTRCRTHFVRNLQTRVPKAAQSLLATLVRSIFAQPDADSVHEQHGRVVSQL